MKKKTDKQRLFEVMGRLDKTFKSKLNENFNDDVEEFTPHGTYTVSNAGGYEIMLNDAGDAAKVRDAFGSDNPETSDWLEIEYIPDEETGESEPVIDPNGYNIPLNQVMRLQENDIDEPEDPEIGHQDYLKQTDQLKSFDDDSVDENSQLPPELSDSEEANNILTKINELLDLLNDPNIDQSEGGVSDKMREMALHMINTNR